MKYCVVIVLSLWMAGAAHAAATAVDAPVETLLWDWPDRDVDMQCLRESYPEHVMGMEDDAQGTWLVMRDGQRVLYEAASAHGEAPQPPVEGVLAPGAGVRQSMAQIYPLEPARPAPAAGEHPGRVRSEDLLRALYGRDRTAVRNQLRFSTVGKSAVLFSSSAGAAEALDRVGAALAEPLRSDPALRAWVLPLAGTFYWRTVAGEKRLSPHSFGIAIDLNAKKGAYWQWSGGVSHPSQQMYPTQVVRAFEDNGFVWGGKWREYDLMHFEYRPEVICKARKMQTFARQESAD